MSVKGGEDSEIYSKYKIIFLVQQDRGGGTIKGKEKLVMWFKHKAKYKNKRIVISGCRRLLCA